MPAGFCINRKWETVGGGVTEWLMVADCKSAGLAPYVGSNPTPTMVAVGRSVGRAVGSNDNRREH